MVPNTVRLVQLVEHQIVVLVVVGSSPTSHPCCNSRRFPGVALCLGAFDTRANFHIIDFRIFHQRDAAGGGSLGVARGAKRLNFSVLIKITSMFSKGLPLLFR